MKLRNLMPVQGLVSEDIQQFEELKEKANSIQIEQMITDLQAELRFKARKEGQ